MPSDSLDGFTRINDLMHQIKLFYSSGQIEKGRALLDTISDSFDLEQPLIREALADAYIMADDTKYYYEWYTNNLDTGVANAGDQILVYALICHNRTKDALDVFNKTFPALSSIHHFNHALKHIPQLIEQKSTRTPYYQSIHNKSKSEIEKTSGKPEQQLWYEILFKSYYCLGNMSDFETTARALVQEYPNIAKRHLDFLMRVLDPQNPKWKNNKVFGIGLSKTGTASLSKALTLLNFSAVHWTNSYSHDLLTIEDAPLFDSLTDISISYLYKELYLKYPDAKFVLTTRSTEAWEKSFLAHYARSLHATSFDDLKRIILHQYPPRFGQRYVDIHKELYFQYTSLQEAFHFHEQNIFDFFKGRENQLLLLDVSKPNAFRNLSDFLGVNCPQNDFPHTNTQKDKDSWVAPISGATRTFDFKNVK